ncbi:hypothetical protein [Streptomyces sp. NPDC054834]
MRRRTLLAGITGGLAAVGTLPLPPSAAISCTFAAYNARKSDGSLPATTFLTTGSPTIGATMN